MSKLRGYVRVRVRGGRLEALINGAASNGLRLWRIARTSEQSMELNISISDFFRLRPLLKQTGCRVHVLKRFGFPFLLDKLLGRRGMLAGGLLFVAGLYILSSLVWQVQVEGNETISRDTVLQAAQANGIQRMQWKFRLEDPDTLSKKMLSQLDGAVWIGVEIQGTRVNIKVVESTLPEERELLSPRHLVASSDAVVTSIVAEKGRPLVGPNTRVRKGDILISGMIGSEEQYESVAAVGEVRGIVWEVASISIPLTRYLKGFTGESKERRYLVIGSRALKISGYGKLAFEHYETEVNRKSLTVRNMKLPFGWAAETLREMTLEEYSLEPQAAKEAALSQARSELLLKSGEAAQIVKENLLHEESENGKVYIEVLFEVDRSIAVEQPIIQGE